MNRDEISIFLKKAEEYISIAIEKEKKKEYGRARNYYLMGAKAIIEAAKRSPKELKKSRIEKADRLTERARNLPKAIDEKVAKEEKRQRLAAALRNNLQKRKRQARNRTEPTPGNSVDSEE